jgi:hypothetical protein
MHAARGASARMADLNAVAESDIRRQGRWNNSAMNGAYLTTLPRGIVRSMAGFLTAEGHFYLPRAQVIPQNRLLKKYSLMSTIGMIVWLITVASELVQQKVFWNFLRFFVSPFFKTLC